MAFRKIEAGLVQSDVDNFIGKKGTIFYDNDLGDFRISDGVTPGGVLLSFGGAGGGSYTLPTATTTVKGGVKIDGSTITIANQVISVGSIPYSKLTNTPTIPSNTNQLTNGAGFITSSALSGYATESFVTSRGYLSDVPEASGSVKGAIKLGRGLTKNGDGTVDAFSGSYNDLTDKPTIPTNTNQLTNGAGFITSSALVDYATESYVTSRGYITSVSWNDIQSKPTFSTVATSGSYTDLANKPTIPTDISQLTDAQGLLGQGGGNGSTNYITNNIENPYSFSVAADDSTLREISNGETLRFQGGQGISITSDAEGKITITGPDLSSYLTSVSWDDVSSKPTFAAVATSGSYNDLTDKPATPTDTSELTNGAGFITTEALTGYATESFVTSRGYITGLSWNELTDKPNLAGTYSWSIAADDSTLREISAGESVKLIGAGGITTSSDADGNITITGIPVDLTGYATESFVTSRGYITGLSWDELTNKPNIAGTYTFNIAGTDSTLHQINSDNTIQFKGSGNINVTTNADGVITINIPSASVVTSDTPPVDPTNGELWWDSVGGNLYIYYDSTWVISNDYANITDYNQLTGLPDLSVYALRSEISQAEAYSFNITADDSTVREITNNETIKIVGAGGITTSSDADGNITITGAAQDRLTNNNRSAVLNSNGTFSLPTLTSAPNNPQAGQIALADGVLWNPISQGGTNPYMVIYTGTGWLGLAGGVTMDQVYEAILELGA